LLRCHFSIYFEDIMLVKLSEPVLDIVPVELNFDATVPADGDPVTVIGFGDTEPDGTFSSTLLETQVEVFPFFDCNSYFGSIVDELMICAGTEMGGRDSCQGDR
jgi:Trypsin